MRKLLALAAAVTTSLAGLALVAPAAPAGIEADPAASATVGYTVLLTEQSMSDLASAREAAAEAPRPTFPYEVGTQQFLCSGQLATVDLTTGAVEPLPAPPSGEACAGDLAFAPDGTLYGLVQGESPCDCLPVALLVRYDLTTGAAEVIGKIGSFDASLGGFFAFGFPAPIGGIEFDAQGRLFAMLAAFSDEPIDDAALGIDGAEVAPAQFDPECQPDDILGLAFCLYEIGDPNTPGTATFVGRSLTNDVFFEPTVGTLAASCDAVYTTRLDLLETFSTDVVTVDTADASLHPLGGLAPERFLQGAAFDRASTFWGLVLAFDDDLSENVATLDPAGGTPIETLGRPVDVNVEDDLVVGLAVEPLDCFPEPAPIVLEPTFTG